jgi:hypothetical protein
MFKLEIEIHEKKIQIGLWSQAPKCFLFVCHRVVNVFSLATKGPHSPKVPKPGSKMAEFN